MKACGVILTEFIVVMYADHVRFHPCHPNALIYYTVPGLTSVAEYIYKMEGVL